MGVLRASLEASRDRLWPADAAPPGGARSWTVLTGNRHMRAPSAIPHHLAVSWHRFGLGPIDLSFLLASPQTVERTQDIAAKHKAADYDLVFLREGSAQLKHSGVEARLPEGSFVLLDNREAYELVFEESSLCATIQLTDRWLRRWVPHPRSLVAQPIASVGWGAPLASMLETIANRGLDEAALPRSVIADQIGALIALMSGKCASPTSLHNGEMLTRLKRRILDRYDDCELDPVTIASEMGISKRHLHGLFAQAGTTFGAVLLDVRLKRAAEMLTDPRYASYRVGDIAWACGFGEPSHFARRFRQRYNASPQAFRGKSGAGEGG